MKAQANLIVAEVGKLFAGGDSNGDSDAEVW